MVDFPPEVWHCVCSHLTAHEARQVRLVCRLINKIALCHSFPKITFYLHQEDLAFLQKIANSPILARNVKQLTYISNLMNTDMILDDFVQARRQAEKMDKEYAMMRKTLYVSKRLTKSELAVCYYKNYIPTVNQQEEALAKFLDFECLAKALPSFKSLEEVTMSGGITYCAGRDTKTPFANCLVELSKHLKPDGCRHLEALIHGLQGLDHKLQRLNAGVISWEFFDRNPIEFKQLLNVCCNLSSLKLEIDTGLIDTGHDDDRILGSEVPDCRVVMKKGLLRYFLAALPRLQVLSILFTFRNEKFDLYPAGLEDVLDPGHKWVDLKELNLQNIECTRQELMATLTLHKDTLRTLSLNSISLKNTSWLKLLPDLRNNLDLEEAMVDEIFGGSELYHGVPEYWSLSGPRSDPAEDDLRYELVRYLVKSTDELPLSHSNMGP
ncbi:hypothetical protein UCRPA7_6997 [Phaeoacremonium minimum UCRPA7]|uniref:F-box domain-containing protein n=1 Tax=Phaeoacremonium minimum (strain UCR-PA7) TaxID=1286976 RepID=R8BEI3_PHAM7|nr:hypothetical protein UCRPA7_6997 [Phaeoacremonium minimum UCRPA7]EON97707.1 hypothetical protein UCRPA7_6997 [Phaeoacremonium minimum UCRPA7]